MTVGGGGGRQYFYTYLGTDDFDAAGLGPIASLFMQITLGEPCGAATVGALPVSWSLVENAPNLGFSNAPIFGTQQLIVVSYGNPSTEHQLASVVASSPTLASVSPFGGQELWVDLMAPQLVLKGTLGPAGTGPEIPTTLGGFAGGVIFDVVIPPFTQALCGQRFRMQAAVLAAGAPPQLSRG